jgi:hypothetical protein
MGAMMGSSARYGSQRRWRRQSHQHLGGTGALGAAQYALELARANA